LQIDHRGAVAIGGEDIVGRVVFQFNYLDGSASAIVAVAPVC
jgi:hypothetical protein